MLHQGRRLSGGAPQRSSVRLVRPTSLRSLPSSPPGCYERPDDVAEREYEQRRAAEDRASARESLLLALLLGALASALLVAAACSAGASFRVHAANVALASLLCAHVVSSPSRLV